MMKEILKAIILIAFLLGTMLLIGSCGVRRTDQSKDIQRVDVQSLKAEKENSTLSSSVRMYESREIITDNIEVYDNETIEETYSLDPDGKPFMSGRTINKSKGAKNIKGSEKVDSGIQTNIDQSKSTDKSDQLDAKLLDKAKNKTTEADKTIASNFGGAEWLLAFLTVFVLLTVKYFLKRKKIKL